MRHWSLHELLVLSCIAMVGCATVDPGPDYQRASEYIAQATKQESVLPPEDCAVVAQRVSELLQGGVTVDEAVEICLLNNPEFQAAWLVIGMARADLVQSGLLSNPSLGVSLRLPAGGGLANLEASLAQNIADLWQIPARRRIAEHALNQAILNLARKAAELVTATKAAYYQAAGASLVHEIALENLSVANQLLEAAIALQGAGAGGQLDVNLARSAVLEAELSVETNRLELAEAKRQMVRLLGLRSVATDLLLADTTPHIDATKFDTESMIRIAQAHRLDLQATREAVLMTQAEVQREYQKIFPTLEIGVALERGERKSQGGRDILADTARASIANGALTASEIQPRSERRANTDLIIGPSIGMDLPIFDQNQAQIAKAKYAHEQASKTLEALSLSVVQEVRSAADRTLTAWKLVQVYRDRSVPLAQNNLDLSREAYRVGRASFLSVLEAQRFLLESRSQYAEAGRKAATSMAELERTIGLPFEALMVEVNATASLITDPEKVEEKM